ncbi:hypothetical protein CYMTET_6540 [Cymbomonas tetramitiformis]|uniref:Uncharacterized protein n=1 Tax=Cymbomonas tetramitiformis TaxID=36881 RepID=A0AAE0GWV4_9CHLO|nr:hypothetical protein CYMTET_6540 [Cymbomonas tetramitiformis]
MATLRSSPPKHSFTFTPSWTADDPWPLSPGKTVLRYTIEQDEEIRNLESSVRTKEYQGAYKAEMKLLDEKKASTQSVDLEDREEVMRICQFYVEFLSWCDICDLKQICAFQGPVFEGMTIYEGENILVKLHFFTKPEETEVHNHSRSFWSYCIAGRYENTIYSLQESTDSILWESSKCDDGPPSTPKKRVGEKLTISTSYSHQRGLIYYIHDSTFHTVKGCQDKRVMTLVVQGKHKTKKTSIIRPDDKGITGNFVPKTRPSPEEAERIKTDILQAAREAGEGETQAMPKICVDMLKRLIIGGLNLAKLLVGENVNREYTEAAFDALQASRQKRQSNFANEMRRAIEVHKSRSDTVTKAAFAIQSGALDRLHELFSQEFGDSMHLPGRGPGHGRGRGRGSDSRRGPSLKGNWGRGADSPRRHTRPRQRTLFLEVKAADGRPYLWSEPDHFGGQDVRKRQRLFSGEALIRLFEEKAGLKEKTYALSTFKIGSVEVISNGQERVC